MSLVNLTSCVGRKSPSNEAKELRSYWGNKEQCITFLNSPSAKSNRWLCEAIGD